MFKAFSPKLLNHWFAITIDFCQINSFNRSSLLSDYVDFRSDRDGLLQACRELRTSVDRSSLVRRRMRDVYGTRTPLRH
jgi:hypothetical protein